MSAPTLRLILGDQLNAAHGPVFSMLTRFQREWSAENNKWVDAVLKAAAADNAGNQAQLSSWAADWLTRASNTLAPVAALALGEKADDLKEIVSGLRAELAEARAETKAVREQAAKDATAWREQIALEHKRNAELQSERDSLADKVTTLEQQEKELMSKLDQLEKKEQGDD